MRLDRREKDALAWLTSIGVCIGALVLLAACSSPAEPEVETVRECPAPPDLSQIPTAGEHWNHSRAVIGQEYEASGEGIAQALRDGRDWLVLDAKSIPLRGPIRLHELTDTRFLVIEGPGGPHMTNITRESPDAGIVAEGTWQLTIRGVTLHGRRDQYPDATQPMLQVQSLDRSRFEDMACLESAGACMVFGDSTAQDGWVSASSFVRVEAERNSGPGLVLIEAADVHLDRMLIQRNGDGTVTPGLLINGRDSGGTLTRSRFEGAGVNGEWGVETRDFRLTAWGNYFWLSHLKMDGGKVYGNRLIDSRVEGAADVTCNERSEA